MERILCEGLMAEEDCCRPGGFLLTEQLLEYAGRPHSPDFSGPLSVLDVGCGKGATVRWLSERFPHWNVRGVDPEAEGDTPLLKGCAEALPFPDDSMDLVFVECVLSGVKEPEKALKELHRVCRPGGRVLISDMYARKGKAGEDPASRAANGGSAEYSASRTAGGETAGHTMPEAAGEKAGSRDAALRIGRLESALVLQQRFASGGFHLLEMQDVSGTLTGWAGQKILEGGSASLEKALGYSLEECRKRRAGYYLACLEPSPLAELLSYAGNHSLFYRKKWAKSGLYEADRIRLEALPLTRPEELCENPESFLCVPPKEIARIITLKSSGSLTKPKRLFFTEKDLECTADFFSYGIRSLVQPGYKVMIFMEGATRFSVGGLLEEGLSRLPAEVKSYGFITNYRDAAEAAEGYDTLIGAPAQMFRLAAEAGWLRPKTVLLSADYAAESVKSFLERTWVCRVFTHWGMTETGYGGGVQCSAREGYHLRDEDLQIEIIDPETGEVLPEGMTGEIVLTTLRRRGMPLIRYRTGDRGRMINTPCPCGCLKPRLDKVRGRLQDEVHLPDGNILSMPVLDEILYALPGLSAFSAVWKEEEKELFVTIRPTDGKQQTTAEEKNPAKDFGTMDENVPAGKTLETVEREKWKWDRDGVENLRKQAEDILEARFGKTAYICVVTGEVRDMVGSRKRLLRRDVSGTAGGAGIPGLPF